MQSSEKFEVSSTEVDGESRVPFPVQTLDVVEHNKIEHSSADTTASQRTISVSNKTKYNEVTI